MRTLAGDGEFKTSDFVGIEADRVAFALKTLSMPLIRPLASFLKRDDFAAAAVVYELRRYLGIEDLPAKKAVKLAIGCPDLCRKILYVMDTEIPF